MEAGLARPIWKVIVGRNDEEDAAAFVRPELAVIGVGIGVHEVAGRQPSIAGVEASG